MKRFFLFFLAPLWCLTITPIFAEDELLGWVTDTRCENLCHGYYQEVDLPIQRPWVFSLNNSPIYLSADQTRLQQTGQSLLIGNVIVKQGNRVIHAEQALLYRDSITHKVIYLDLLGKVSVSEPGTLIKGKGARVQLQTLASQVKDVHYRIMLDQDGQAEVSSLLFARGRAKRITQDEKQVISLDESTYTTCPPRDSSWQLSARKIDLYRDVGRGVAKNAVLKVKGVPVLFTPYFNFPLDKRRQTGFVSPTFSSSSDGGFSFSAPYYVNLAPNYDFLFTPTAYAKRGLLMEGLYRYLTPQSGGTLSGAYIPRDYAFSKFRNDGPILYPGNPALPALIKASADRGYFSWQHQVTFNPHWNANVDYSQASDDYYYNDFGNIRAVNISNQLFQNAQLNYVDETWAIRGLLQRYQTLHPINFAATSNQYSRLPELSMQGYFPEKYLGMNYQLNGGYTHFIREVNPGEVGFPPNGERTNLQPQVSWPWQSASGYFIPTVQLQATNYVLNDQPMAFSRGMTRTLPLVNIDSGIFFDRDLEIGNEEYQQTLEPRVYYLYVPYRNQTQIPIFDSGLQPFTYDQLFLNNRFTSIDRVGDANQISLAVSTRFFDKNEGIERLRFSLGSIYYFKDRQVMLCGTPGCQDIVPNTIPPIGVLPPTEKMSPLVAQLNYLLNPKWTLTGDWAWDLHTHDTTNANLNFHYQPVPSHVLNLGYHFIQYGDAFAGAPPTSSKNSFNQSVLSFAWPVTFRWSALGSWSYNISHQHTQTYFAGLEYNSCCFATRVVVAHTFSALNSANQPIYNRAVYLQLELKGVGNFATNNPAGLLRGIIPGFHDTFVKGNFI